MKPKKKKKKKKGRLSFAPENAILAPFLMWFVLTSQTSLGSRLVHTQHQECGERLCGLNSAAATLAQLICNLFCTVHHNGGSRAMQCDQGRQATYVYIFDEKKIFLKKNPKKNNHPFCEKAT